GRDTAHDGGAAARLQVLLVLQPRLAEVHLRVDHARQDVEAASVDDLGRRGAGEVAQCRNPSTADADVPLRPPVMVDDGAAVEDEVVGGGHGGAPDAINTATGRAGRCTAADGVRSLPPTTAASDSLAEGLPASGCRWENG